MAEDSSDWESFVNGPFIQKPVPWDLKCTAYMIPFWTSAHRAKNLPVKAYSPLEASSSFASKEFGEPVGGLSMIQLLRYTESPFGPYDEMILAPGFFRYPVSDKDGKKASATNARITRIYVSQKQTCWNGRSAYNVPKHLARFEWTERLDGSTHVRVFPHDTTDHTGEARPGEKLFFQCTIRPAKYLPGFPMSTGLFRYLGIDDTLVQPPLPAGNPAAEQGALVGTERWCRLAGYTMSSSSSSLVWADMSQKDGDMDGNRADAPDDGYENFFPGLRRWNLALKMADGKLHFPAPETWETPKGLV